MDTQHAFERIRGELIGHYFSNKSELRHLAEGAGFDFVPVDFLSGDDKVMVAALRPKGLAEIRVEAHRTRSREPFLITDVKPA